MRETGLLISMDLQSIYTEGKQIVATPPQIPGNNHASFGSYLHKSSAQLWYKLGFAKLIFLPQSWRLGFVERQAIRPVLDCASHGMGGFVVRDNFLLGKIDTPLLVMG